MKTHPTVEFAQDGAANILEMRYHGHVAAADLAAALPGLPGQFAGLRPGFTVLVDLTDLERMDLDCEAPLGRIMDFSRECGVGLVVRLIPDPARDIGFGILTIFHYPRKVRVVTCATRAEAEQALGRKTKLKGEG